MSASAWTPTVLESGAGGWSVTVHFDTGGNPDEFRRILMLAAAAPSPQTVSSVTTLHLLNGAMYLPAMQGAITSISYSESAILFPGSQAAQQSGPMVRQSGRYFIAPAVTVASASWQTLAAGPLFPASFVHLDTSAPGGLNPAQHPDFSNTAPPLEFGFFRRSSTTPGGPQVLTDAGMDNFSITLVTPSCTADFNNDGMVNTTDLIQVLLRFGQAVAPGTPADLNHDGVVNTTDLVQLLVRFGQPCG